MPDEGTWQDKVVRRGPAHEFVEDVDRIFTTSNVGADQAIRMIPLNGLQAADPTLRNRIASVDVDLGYEGWLRPTFDSKRSLSRTITGPGWAYSGVRSHLRVHEIISVPFW